MKEKGNGTDQTFLGSAQSLRGSFQTVPGEPAACAYNGER